MKPNKKRKTPLNEELSEKRSQKRRKRTKTKYKHKNHWMRETYDNPLPNDLDEEE